MEVKQLDIVLCEFFFSDIQKSKNRSVLVFKDNLPYDDLLMGTLPKKSKLMIRKNFVVSKKVVLKKYGTLNRESYNKYHRAFCNYFICN